MGEAKAGFCFCRVVNWLAGAHGSLKRPDQTTPGLTEHVTRNPNFVISRRHRWHGIEHPSRPFASRRQVRIVGPALRRIHRTIEPLPTPLLSARRCHAIMSRRSAHKRCELHATTMPLPVEANTVLEALIMSTSAREAHISHGRKIWERARVRAMRPYRVRAGRL